MSSSLVIILFYDNAWPHIAKMILQKLTDLRYPPYSLNLSHTDYVFIKYQDSFLKPKIIHSKEVKTAFKDFLISKPSEFYHTGVNNPVN